MMKQNFKDKLEAVWKENNSLVCVGLDTDFGKIPEHLKKMKEPLSTFNKEIIEATHDLVCAYKPNLAFYEAQGLAGLQQLKNTVDYLKKFYPEIPVIADAKRADIGNTNTGYVQSLFDDFKFDAVTVHPYLGKEALEPFLQRKDKGIIVLCRTSNPGAGEFQDLMVEDSELGKLPLYQFVAQRVVKHWNKNGNCLLVVGATYARELAEIRRVAPQMTFLVPGIGVQGGDVKKSILAGKDLGGKGMIINSSRGIIFADPGKNFAMAAREKAKSLKEEINKYR